MKSKIKILRKELQSVNKWSGGSTIELAIYPEDAQYINRSFEWRISTAVIEDEKSTFTSLPGYQRHLMLLDGHVKLEHQNYHTVELVPFKKDFFYGSWNTICTGKCSDFNLMLNTEWDGELEAVTLGTNQKLDNVEKLDFLGIYCYTGEVSLVIGNDDIEILNEKDFVLVNLQKAVNPIVTANCESCIILAKVKMGNKNI